MQAEFDIKSVKGKYQVYCDGCPVGAPCGSWEKGQDRIARLQRDAQLLERKCMSCPEKFMSEGAHNRLCDRCRATASDLVAV